MFFNLYGLTEPLKVTRYPNSQKNEYHRNTKDNYLLDEMNRKILILQVKLNRIIRKVPPARAQCKALEYKIRLMENVIKKLIEQGENSKICSGKRKTKIKKQK